MVRDVMMRYGREHLGFVWVILEPMLLTTGVLIVWSLIRPSQEHGIRLIGLVITGYMPLTLWRHLTNSASLLFRRSTAMLYHRNLSLLDIFLSRQLLEFAGATAALMFVYFTLVVAGLLEPVHDFTLALAGWLMMGWLALGVSSLTVVLSEKYEIAERFIQPFQYLQLPISGTFFLVDWLPYDAQQIIWYNPTVHCYEMFRAGFFGPSIVTYYSPLYVGIWAFTLSSIGLSAIAHMRSHIRIV
ncbi:capsular polysaccharide transport system permease protein [Enhydrobacter aerosaccus]|uniref:Capsular polysaccharide transport system permease protein n=1 Tax=Enhydrobacter aerosaccus TaxID=225324 RepID=A0A1T4T7P8_9HYPH|nr:ABC transporter permease [Enhydrobacter aerosaccus]SKA36261.1 capsular polysaccharide transport system permease protein [Enhydrobacter aerosaccus]